MQQQAQAALAPACTQQAEQPQRQHLQGPRQQRTRPTQGCLVERVLERWEAKSSDWPHELVDIGVNLADRSFEKDRDAVLLRAARAGVRTLLLTGTCVRTSKAAADMCDAGATGAAAVAAAGSGSRPPRTFFTAGVHPHNAKGCGPATLGELQALASHPSCRAIGECGLDFNRNFSPPDAQERWFAAQVQLAEALGLPLFLHCRDAHPRFVELLRQHRRGVAAVAHCYTGVSPQELQASELLDLGLHIGITGWICDDRPDRGAAALAQLLPLVPDDRLLLETDAPYLVPRSIVPAKVRPSRNEPALLPAVLEAVAAARGQTAAHVAAVTTANAQRVFGF